MELQIKIFLLGFFSCLADFLSSALVIQHPEIYEKNPHYNFFAELGAVTLSSLALRGLGESLKVSKKAAATASAIPAAMPLMLATSNLSLYAKVKAKDYPWEEITLLYPEEAKIKMEKT